MGEGCGRASAPPSSGMQDNALAGLRFSDIQRISKLNRDSRRKEPEEGHALGVFTLWNFRQRHGHGQ